MNDQEQTRINFRVDAKDYHLKLCRYISETERALKAGERNYLSQLKECQTFIEDFLDSQYDDSNLWFDLDKNRNEAKKGTDKGERPRQFEAEASDAAAR